MKSKQSSEITDSSEDEDLSRFQEAVDTSFINLINKKSNDLSQSVKSDLKPRSERYLEEATHYNDVRVSDEMQRRIGTKVSEIINKNIKFINVQGNDTRPQEVEGGVKLFRDSTGFLSCEDLPDVFTKQHNELSRKNKRRRHHIHDDEDEMDEGAKVKSVAVSGDHILSRDDTKCWKSRRKEKIFKYKVKRNNVLTAVE